MDKIYQKIQEKTKDWNVDQIVSAIIEDEPDLAEYAHDLHETLTDMKNGDYSNARVTQIAVSPIAATRHQMQLSQPKFAEKLGISLNTLRSWEQGLRNPSGAAKTLLDLLQRKPELINELH
ncbi:helix-turn-helix domain-containing protein [Pasteurellaceae bacterium USgator11]|nr:helix-turn-helix domain-containing protein [Pasteurellaceae bacterium USgator41]TNG94024.1 helix-turn-helix domain-containing protein [Pasteurellaceae bacterium UScroc12]TNG97734.1 helix-turn-helix domain-containing protein [Pasteurellaceae bacterium UScroc31]TNH01695.1 helix-turn-helix domain-containing protein [Pasteurellaceae bacterium USgator11]